jgi:hypothetical protein
VDCNGCNQRLKASFAYCVFNSFYLHHAVFVLVFFKFCFNLAELKLLSRFYFVSE